MEDDSCLYFYVLYSHQTHPSTPKPVTHHGLGGAVQLLHTPPNHIPHHTSTQRNTAYTGEVVCI